MTRDRGLVLDLDDTLYRVRRFSLSGYRAVAIALAARAVDPCLAFRVLCHAHCRGEGSRAFQALEERIGVDHGVDLLGVYRAHEPSLRLPVSTARALATARATWRVGVLTNGLPDQQRRKVASLGLAPLVDAVVYAHETCPTGKPDRRAFEVILDRLRLPPSRAVVVGDDPACDIAGGRAAGCATIRIARPGRVIDPARDEADAVIRDLGEVCAEAERVLNERTRR